MTIDQMVIEIRKYVEVNTKAYKYLRGKAVLSLLDHLSQVASDIDGYCEDTDGYSDDIRSLYNELMGA